VTGKKIPQRVQILHYIRDQYGKFQYPDIFGSILECGLLMTLLILPTPGVKDIKEKCTFLSNIKCKLFQKIPFFVVLQK
jgi:hypothetical protein